MKQVKTQASNKGYTAGSFLRFLASSIIAGLALAFVIVYLWPNISERLSHEPEEVTAVPTTPAAPVSYADAVDRAAPSVVSIYTTKVEKKRLPVRLQRIFGSAYVSNKRKEMGSGVLVSEDGYILTNDHVISQVQDITVGLWDGRYATAQVVGSDPETDLAVLKVDLEGLPAAPLAEEVNLRVGDVVLAIGNAFGFSHTVTMGIISATGRNVGSVLYEDFIQTDAAINAGNSGGALINYRGEVIGINTRNLGWNQGAQNIGFAIPIEMAKDVMQQIVENGSVRRGSLGAVFSDRLPLSQQTDGSAVRLGIQVEQVTPNGPAWSAGIRPGDILLSMDGLEIVDASALLLTISQRQPGGRVEFVVQRDSDIFETYATLIQQPPLR